jgi:GR25 family glycosyltransferase involved in LPS biosynthesis
LVPTKNNSPSDKNQNKIMTMESGDAIVKGPLLDQFRGFNFYSDGSIEVHVIHLPHAVQRKATFLAMNRAEGITFAFTDGIDSERLDLGDLKRRNLIEPSTTFRTPGCGLAHRNLWLKSVQLGRPIIVCEDDAVVRRDFRERFVDCVSALPENWGFLLLGYNFDNFLDVDIVSSSEQYRGRFTNKRLGISELHHFKNTTLPVGALPLLLAFGLPGYSVSPKGAQFLLSNVFPLNNRPITIPSRGAKVIPHTVDTIMNGLYSRMKAYVCMPPLVVTPNEKDPAAKLVRID